MAGVALSQQATLNSDGSVSLGHLYSQVGEHQALVAMGDLQALLAEEVGVGNPQVAVAMDLPQ